MKTLLVLSLIGMIAADSKPQFVYYTNPYVYTQAVNPVVYSYNRPLVYTSAAGCTNHLGMAVPCNMGGYQYNVMPTMAMPSEAMPSEMMPKMAMPSEAMPSEVMPKMAREDEKMEEVHEAAVSVEKRDAEAEADPVYLYSNYFNTPYNYYNLHPYQSVYRYNYLPYAYAGCRNSYGAVVPCA